MGAAVRVHKAGGPEVLKFEDVDVPAPGPGQIRVKQGDQVAFAVHVDQPDTVHVHGYDIEKDVQPGKDTKISFTADITGIFDIELHSTDEQIAQLRVDPN